MARSQRGASGLFVALILLLVVAGALAILALSRGTAQIERGTKLAGNFKLLQDAFLQYVAANGRLPCPANPGELPLDTGEEKPAGPGACTFPDVNVMGSVPWKTIGVRKEDAMDPWGGKISYAVYTGPGSLTQPGGASMVNCESNGSNEPSPQPVGLDKLCLPSKDSFEGDFLTAGTFLFNKGLQVKNFSTLVTDKDVAYVLISHGPSGLGSFTSAQIQKDLPSIGNTNERANLNSGQPFLAREASAQGTGPEDAEHFDDILVFAKLGDLLRRAGQGGREWPDPPVAVALKFDAPSVTAALGAPVSPGPLGTATLNFGGVAQVTGADLGGVSALSFDDTGTYSGIGVAGGGSYLIQSSANESLVIDFTNRATQFGATLGDFGAYGVFYVELVRFDFYLDGTGITSAFGFGCNADGGLASFFADLGTDFNRVVIVPVPSINFFPPPGSGITAFLVSEVAACPASASGCRTSLDTPANRCT